MSHTYLHLPVPKAIAAKSILKYVSYYRVSTVGQGRSGLGLEAQRESVRRFLASQSAMVVSEFVEVESGRKDDRPKLIQALELCRQTKCTLLIAKLDRLARSVSFVANLMDGNVDFVAADMPGAGRFMLHIMAAVAEHERQIIGERTKAALAAAKARGIKLGKNGMVLAAKHKANAETFAIETGPFIALARQAGASTTREIAEFMNSREIAPRQNGRWHAASVARVLRRLDKLDAAGA